MNNICRKALSIKTISNYSNGYLQKCTIHLSTTNSINQKWRKDKGLTANPNAHGPLTNFPDYTYMDGRPTPLGSRQRERVLKQRDIATKIVQALSEVDYAVDRHKKLAEEKVKHEQAIIASKLKPKGHLLLKKGN